MTKYLLLFHLIASIASGQPLPDLSAYKTSREKLEQLSRLCDSLYLADNLEAEKRFARYGLSITPTTDYNNLARFNFFLGAVHETAASPDSSEYFYTKSKKYAYASKNPRRIQNALIRLLTLYSNHLGSTAKGRAILKENLAFIDSTKSELARVKLYAAVASYYNMLGQYETQVSYLLKGIEAQKAMIASGAITDREAVVVDLVNLAEFYLEQDKSEKAIGYLKDARRYIETTVDYFNYYYKRMAEAYLLENAYADSKVYFDSLLLYADKHPDDASTQVTVATTQLSYAAHYLEKNQIDLAYSFVRKANETGKGFLGGIEKAQLDLVTGEVLAARGDYAAALRHLEDAGRFGYEIGPQHYVSVLLTLSRCYSKLGRWQDAYRTLDKYVPLRDSLYTEISKKSIADAEAVYQNKAKQMEIDEQKSELESVRKQRIWLGSAALMGGLIALLLYIIYRNKERSASRLDAKNKELNQVISELEEANKTKVKLFSILSHDLRSPISQVYQFLKLQQVNPKVFSENQKQELSSKIQTATGSLLETMEELLMWSKTQMSAFNIQVRPVEVLPIITNTLNLLQLNVEANETDIEIEIPEDFMVDTDAYFLQTILRNLLQNAIRSAGKNGEVRIGAGSTGTGKGLYVENAGTAFTQAEYEAILADDMAPGLNGLGLRLIDDLSVKLGAKVTFSGAQNRTKAVIDFPD
ncbi:Signal transduction histidine kinase [Dyadobacter soli]|uniref:histidine kinase n=1 Tax=Dyadobacter soli TaxID=659014 RepID=A0A1G8CLK1_9BACT|nr:ATP-binding protein [Dyadobacter soli]SDH46338.1 Signal transduction histidine kinase [Dyadobacter soli]